MPENINDRVDYDSPWKEILRLYFQPFLEFFFPQIYNIIDWSIAPEFLDKELEKIIRSSEIKGQIVDKVAEVRLKDGKSIWVLIHVEVQASYVKDFAHRIYIYNHKLSDNYGKNVISLAVLIDNNPKFRPQKYSIQYANFSLQFEFPIAKLLDYVEKTDELEKSDNIFAMVVIAHLKAQEIRKDSVEHKFDWKYQLIVMLRQKQYKDDDIKELIRFIDWLIVLPPQVEKNLWHKIQTQEDLNMATYVTSIEKIGMEKGMEQGIEKGIEKGIEQGMQKAKIAINMIKKNIDIATVSKLSGLTQNQVLEIKQEMDLL